MKMTVLFFIVLAFVSTPVIAEERVKITVKGMVCSFCSQGITKKFKEQNGLKDIKVSLEEHLVSFTVNNGQKIENEKIETILKDAGYGVEKIERE